MTAPALTPTLREALTKALEVDAGLTVDEYDALEELRDACPERPALEDGIYEVPDGDGDYHPWYVRDGHHASHRRPDDTLYGGLPLPDDVSGWRRIDGPPTVTPEGVDAAARRILDYTESQWAQLSEELRDYYRNRVRRILAVAGDEVSEP